MVHIYLLFLANIQLFGTFSFQDTQIDLQSENVRSQCSVNIDEFHFQAMRAIDDIHSTSFNSTASRAVPETTLGKHAGNVLVGRPDLSPTIGE